MEQESEADLPGAGLAQHYLASLLAAKGLEEETDCIGAMTYTHWWGNWKKMQPETYVRDEVCGDLIEQLRCATPHTQIVTNNEIGGECDEPPSQHFSMCLRARVHGRRGVCD